ncbi:hypothetical protein MtrunA17_Chr2g0333461 [Medicago truncatula]|uniref:Transmembrane protein n=1 Tax=Medicago truncatula TaxID=3880 RepID=A0A396JEA2_MEDTR|nr:hypothetical protein MtrunA17_Chr2g0333461 [Medicago truncatula]
MDCIAEKIATDLIVEGSAAAAVAVAVVAAVGGAVAVAAILLWIL